MSNIMADAYFRVIQLFMKADDASPKLETNEHEFQRLKKMLLPDLRANKLEHLKKLRNKKRAGSIMNDFEEAELVFLTKQLWGKAP